MFNDMLKARQNAGAGSGGSGGGGGSAVPGRDTRSEAAPVVMEAPRKNEIVREVLPETGKNIPEEVELVCRVFDGTIIQT
jgi:hypothetical protein